MDIKLKKSKMFWLCLIPALTLITNVVSIIRAKNSIMMTGSSQNVMAMLGLFIGMGIIISCIYLYFGFLFFKKKILFYTVFAIINFIWFALNIIEVIKTMFIPFQASNSVVGNDIQCIIYILFEAINIYLILTYNHYKGEKAIA